MSQKQERSQETIASIMHAAMVLGPKKAGGREVTVRDICAEAGVSVGAFYHHFSSRDELFERSFEYFDLALTKRMDKLEEKKSPKDALIDLLMFQTSFIAQEGPEFVSHYYRSILCHTNKGAVSPRRAYYQAAYRCLQRLSDEGLLYEDCPPDRTAELCINFVRGCLLEWSFHDNSYDIVSYMRNVLPIFLRSCLKEESVPSEDEEN